MKFAPALILLALAAAPPHVAAAESYDNCTGFIDSLPAVITTQGTWCLRKDLATAMTSGEAILVQTNNVTIDCNHFKLGGLSAGDESTAAGIRSLNRDNITVRNCSIRGFHSGIRLEGSGNGHLVEDNRFDNNLVYGMWVAGRENLVRRNLVFDTGGSTIGESAFAYGIYVYGSAVDNTVRNVFGTGTDGGARGIWGNLVGTELRDNVVAGIESAGTGTAAGIQANARGIRLIGNHVYAPADTAGWAFVAGGLETFCVGNTATGFATPYTGCEYSQGNLPAP